MEKSSRQKPNFLRHEFQPLRDCAEKARWFFLRSWNFRSIHSPPPEEFPGARGVFLVIVLLVFISESVRNRAFICAPIFHGVSRSFMRVCMLLNSSLTNHADTRRNRGRAVGCQPCADARALLRSAMDVPSFRQVDELLPGESGGAANETQFLASLTKPTLVLSGKLPRRAKFSSAVFCAQPADLILLRRIRNEL